MYLDVAVTGSAMGWGKSEKFSDGGKPVGCGDSEIGRNRNDR
jgi:hypothetical protein